MKYRNSFIGFFTLFILTTLLSACGSSTSKSAVVNTPHPKFLRSKVNNSPSYSPSGQITTTNPTFSWKAIENASGYFFGHEAIYDGSQWHGYTISADDAGCYNIGDTCSYTPDDYAIPFNVEMVWWIRAKVRGDLNWKNWSRPIVFTVTNGGGNNGGIPDTIAPTGNINTTTPEFSWTNVSGATRYLLGYEDATNADGWQGHNISATTANCSQNCKFTPSNTGLYQGQDIAWWVKAKVNGVWGEWSATQAFHIEASSAKIPNEPYQFFCNGIDNRIPVVPSALINGITFNGDWYQINPANDTELLVTDSSGNTSVAASNLGATSLVSTNGALYVHAKGFNYYRVNNGADPIYIANHGLGKGRKSQFSFANGYTYFTSFRSKVRLSQHSSKGTQIILENDRANAFELYFYNTQLYVSTKKPNEEKKLGFFNGGGKIQYISLCK